MISIIIVTYNSEKTIKRCLSSIPNSENFEIILVDNNSRDGTINLLAKTGGKINITKNDKNLGLTKAWNIGAKKSNGDIFIFLNPDTIFQKGKISDLKNIFDNIDNPGVIGFNFLNRNLSLQPSAGNFPNIINVISDRIPFLGRVCGMQIRSKKFYDKRREVDWVSGSGFAVKGEVFEKVAGFDEKIFMYCEDIDFCKRVKDLGYTNYYIPNISFVHLDSGKNTLERKPHKYYHMRKGLLYYLAKNNNKVQRIMFRFLIIFESKIRIKFSSNDEWSRYLKMSTQLK